MSHMNVRTHLVLYGGPRCAHSDCSWTCMHSHLRVLGVRVLSDDRKDLEDTTTHTACSTVYSQRAPRAMPQHCMQGCACVMHACSWHIRAPVMSLECTGKAGFLDHTVAHYISGRVLLAEARRIVSERSTQVRSVRRNISGRSGHSVLGGCDRRLVVALGRPCRPALPSKSPTAGLWMLRIAATLGS